MRLFRDIFKQCDLFFFPFGINFCWMTNSLIGPIFFSCVYKEGEKLLTLSLKNIHVGKSQAKVWFCQENIKTDFPEKKLVSDLLKGKKAPLEVEESSGNTIRSCHYQTHSFAMNLQRFGARMLTKYNIENGKEENCLSYQYRNGLQHSILQTSPEGILPIRALKLTSMKIKPELNRTIGSNIQVLPCMIL